jgi:hypothetical protein
MRMPHGKGKCTNMVHAGWRACVFGWLLRGWDWRDSGAVGARAARSARPMSDPRSHVHAACRMSQPPVRTEDRDGLSRVWVQRD